MIWLKTKVYPQVMVEPKCIGVRIIVIQAQAPKGENFNSLCASTFELSLLFLVSSISNYNPGWTCMIKEAMIWHFGGAERWQQTGLVVLPILPEMSDLWCRGYVGFPSRLTTWYFKRWPQLVSACRSSGEKEDSKIP